MRIEKTLRSRVWRKKTYQYIAFAALFCAAIIALSLVPRIEPSVPASTALDSAAGLVISEAMSSNRTTLTDDHGDYSDWAEITNMGNRPVNLGGAGFSDRPSESRFVFPNITLAPGDSVIVFMSGKHENSPKKPLHAPFKLSADGETLFLFNSDGYPIDAMEVPSLGQDLSYALLPSSAASSPSEREYFITDKPTPGYPNTDAGYEAMNMNASTDLARLRLNEICTRGRGSVTDANGYAADWIEIFNDGDVALDLAGAGLSDNETKPLKWTFPKGAIIPARSALLVLASGSSQNYDGKYYHASFKLNGTSETVVLSNSRGQLLDKVRVEGLDKDESLQRPEGMTEWRRSKSISPGYANNSEGIRLYDESIKNANNSGLLITEAVTYTSGMATPYGRSSYDWVEILNMSGEPINMEGYWLSDKPGRPRLWRFPSVTVNPGEYMLVFCSGLTEPPKGSRAIHSTIRLSALGEQVTLADPAGNVIDKLIIPPLEPDTSYGRSLAQHAPMYYDKPTPGAPNAPGFPGYAAAPIVRTPGGSFKAPMTVEITAAEGATVHYTLDGSDPTEASPLYTEPVAINKTAPLRARAFVDGLRPSQIITNTYLINLYHELPVISLVTEPDNLWNPTTGIYAGSFLDSRRTRPAYSDLPYWKKNRVAGHFEFYETDGTRVVSEGVELALHGQFSLDIPQKSFRVTAKARYGSTELAHAFFEDRPYDTYYSLVIRNGGNDGKYTRIADGLQSRIVDWSGTNLYHMPWRPVVVYLNGVYWGHYNLRERVNVHSLARHEGWDDPDNVDLIKADKQVLQGSYDNYAQLLNFVKTHNLNDPAALQTVLNWMDVDNYFDYMIFEMYFGNTDTGNIKFYRRRAEGEKWKWVLFDLDWGMFQANRNGPQIWLDPKGTGVYNFDNTLILKLLDVPQMRDKFLRRYGELFQTVFIPERMIAEMYSMVAMIENEMLPHFNRWAWDNDMRLDIEAPANPEGAMVYWRSRVSRMERVILNRSYYEWGNVQNWFKLSDQQMIDYFGPRPAAPQ